MPSAPIASDSAHDGIDIDCRGELCPLPVLKARRALHQMRTGQRLQIRCTDPLAELDLRALCAREGHHFETLQQDVDGVQLMVLRAR